MLNFDSNHKSTLIIEFVNEPKGTEYKSRGTVCAVVIWEVSSRSLFPSNVLFQNNSHITDDSPSVIDDTPSLPHIFNAFNVTAHPHITAHSVPEGTNVT